MSTERITWVEIDLKVCSLDWGVAPCQAVLSNDTPNKCFNNFRTCGDTDNYTETVKTITLTPEGQVGLPIDGRYFPCLKSVKESEQTVNIAASDPKLSALGKRASATIKFSDFRYEDRFLDKHYDGRLDGSAQLDGVGYEPAGMLWSRLRARDPYFAGYAVRINSGRVEGGALIADRTTNYIMREFNVVRGEAEIEVVDVLDLAANERSMIPIPSVGQLAEDIDETKTTFKLDDGSGVEYSSSGYVTVGREIMSFTRSGDTMTVRRGAFNTDIKSHKNGDVVQQAYRFTGKAWEAVDDILTNYTETPDEWIPRAEWEAEAEIWFNVDVDTIITKPMEVVEVIGEMSLLGFSLYTDLPNKKIRFRPNRFLFPSEERAVPIITDDDIICELDYDGRDDKRLTRVEFRHDQIDPTDGLDEENFHKQYMVIAGDQEDPRAHGDIRYHMERTRWLNQSNTVQTRVLANRYLRRFKTAPERITIVVKDRKYNDLELTGHVGLITRWLPDEFSRVRLQLFQVIKRDKVVNRGRYTGEIKLTLQRFEYDGKFGFWAPNNAPDYDNATDKQKEEMGFWGPNTGETFADGGKIYEWG